MNLQSNLENQYFSIVRYIETKDEPYDDGYSPFFGLGRCGIEIEYKNGAWSLYVCNPRKEKQYYKYGTYYTQDSLISGVMDIAIEEGLCLY